MLEEEQEGEDAKVVMVAEEEVKEGEEEEVADGTYLSHFTYHRGIMTP